MNLPQGPFYRAFNFLVLQIYGYKIHCIYKILKKATVKQEWISTKATLPYFAKGHLITIHYFYIKI